MADLIFAGITTPGQILHGRNAEEVALINWEAATWSDGSNPPGVGGTRLPPEVFDRSYGGRRRSSRHARHVDTKIKEKKSSKTATIIKIFIKKYLGRGVEI
jgi:hypothetical protein